MLNPTLGNVKAQAFLSQGTPPLELLEGAQLKG